MSVASFQIRPGVGVGPDAGLLVIAGPCVIESADLCQEVAGRMKSVCAKLDLPYVFKASFDKANRTSISSFRGPGLESGLEILAAVKEKWDVPVLTDVHVPEQAARAAQVADVLQIPAFLCRQTDLLVAAGETGRPVNVKKGQFLAAADMRTAVGKIHSTGNRQVMLTERGTTFGYHNLVVDMRSLILMGGLGVPVVFDCTHAVQLPGGQGASSGGQREFVFPLARAAAAVGVQGLFMEVHPDPASALCDGPNSIPLDEVEKILAAVKRIYEFVAKSSPDTGRDS